MEKYLGKAKGFVKKQEHLFLGFCSHLGIELHRSSWVNVQIDESFMHSIGEFFGHLIAPLDLVGMQALR